MTRLSREALIAQQQDLSLFIRQGGYLQVENIDGDKRVMRTEKPGFFKRIAHLFYKPQGERYETICETLFDLIEKNGELVNTACRLTSFFKKNHAYLSRLRKLVIGKSMPSSHRQEALNKGGNCWILCHHGKQVSAHAITLYQVDWFANMLRHKQTQRDAQQNEITIYLENFDAKVVEALLDCIYDGRVYQECSDEEVTQLYSLMDYLCYYRFTAIPSFVEDMETCSYEERAWVTDLIFMRTSQSSFTKH